jgi:hypothetical protein
MKKNILYVGLDVHKKAIDVTLTAGGAEVEGCQKETPRILCLRESAWLTEIMALFSFLYPRSL